MPYTFVLFQNKCGQNGRLQRGLSVHRNARFKLVTVGVLARTVDVKRNRRWVGHKRRTLTPGVHFHFDFH